MKRIQKLRNLGIIAHVDAGKTTATERMLYYTGLTHKLGNVDDGNTTMDKDPQEMKRGITIHSAAITTYWQYQNQKYQFNLIDTPGHVDFAAEVERSLRVLDGAVALFCAKSGVEPQSESVWQQANRYHVPRIAFINKMDREGADFFQVLEEMKKELGANPIALQIPVGAGKEFKGIIDLIHENYLEWNAEDQGKTWNISSIPNSMSGQVQHWRHHLFEQIADLDLEFLDLYVSEELEISADNILAALRRITLSLKGQPVLLGAAYHNIGVQPVLDAIVQFLPSPEDVHETVGTHPDSGKEVTRLNRVEEPFSALVFKVLTDEFVGKMALVRVYSGKMENGDKVLIPRTGNRLKINRLNRIHSDKFEPVNISEAGEITAIVGLKDVRTGDTLSAIHAPILLEEMQFSEPVVGYAIEPKTVKDEKRLAGVLRKLMDEDPTLLAVTDEETNQTILRGMGELHLEVILERMRTEFDLPISIGKPRVAFKETLSDTIKWKTRFKKQTGGNGHFAEIHFEIGPGKEGSSGLTFINEVKGGNIPTTFIGSVEKGFKQAMISGPLKGYPLENMMVRLTDGDFHREDSSALDFETVAQIAFREAAHMASPILLEPLMEVEVMTRDTYTGTISGDINRRNGVLRGINTRGKQQIIKASVPLRNLFGYANELRQMSAGRARASMRFIGYEPAPNSLIEA